MAAERSCPGPLLASRRSRSILFALASAWRLKSWAMSPFVPLGKSSRLRRTTKPASQNVVTSGVREPGYVAVQ